ncbi:ribonuclease P protein subunit p40 isoform X3 [Rhinoraja longicauda]
MLLRGLGGGGARHLAVSERSGARRGPDVTGRRVDAHHYNHRVSILIPECGMVPPAITAICKSLVNYYLVKQLPLHELLAPEFINTFVKKGKCYALSYNTRIDEDNVVALLPTGKLILSVDKDTYQELGLEGQPSKYSHRTVMRYIVTVDLSEASFVPGGKRYDRVLWALREKKPLIFDLLMSCDSSAGGREASLASYFTQYQCQAYVPKLATRILNGTSCPVLLSSELDGKGCESCDSLEFLDWLGAVFCDVDWLYFEEPKLAQWLSVTVHGFADSPVSWGQSEHGYHKGGENLYNVVLFSNQDCWLHMAVGTQSDCPP